MHCCMFDDMHIITRLLGGAGRSRYRVCPSVAAAAVALITASGGAKSGSPTESEMMSFPYSTRKTTAYEGV